MISPVIVDGTTSARQELAGENFRLIKIRAAQVKATNGTNQLAAIFRKPRRTVRADLLGLYWPGLFWSWFGIVLRLAARLHARTIFFSSALHKQNDRAVYK
jgi:hypothetical protein